MRNDPFLRLNTYSLDKAATPSDEARIGAFEAELGTTLPEDYRRFLMRSGPVGIEGAARIPVEGTRQTSISALYGLGCKKSWDLRNNTMQTYAGRIPDETIPIGEDGDSGDLALLLVEGQGRGQVYVWWHDHPEIDSARLAKMRTDLQAAGHNVAQMNDAALIHTWENSHSDELGYKPLWGNIRRIAGSFEELLSLLAG